ncbi:pseudouridine synthase [Aphanothece sacrum]|uniref:Pseudouridine synthase n=1 Tax=Aphanothece sacrum FPU1 TaxID=1920663 RepID=A0A401IHS3_APHSA|nr:pseudouridine synthase [Aphanothece sacrum]GBF80779.1 pseudouridine synthase [Aphanothece sacrum FPU1]GBF83274.1 pseudouridine synthase [Aphanothece sacrum FPU3]
MIERVQKILSQWGIASRRHAEALILAGRVKLNGQVVQLGDKADPQRDRLEVDGKVIQPLERPQLIYILLHKPAGVVSTCSDPQNRPTVLELLPQELSYRMGIHPVGRLDFNTTGALLLTNDGELTLKLTHPRYHLSKTYQVTIEGDPTETELQQWREGVMLMGKNTLPAEVKVITRSPEHTHLQVILTEGKNRQIRRIVEQLGFSVLRLHRSAISSLTLHQPNLFSGQYRLLTPSEIDFLKQSANLITETQGKLI